MNIGSVVDQCLGFQAIITLKEKLMQCCKASLHVTIIYGKKYVPKPQVVAQLSAHLAYSVDVCPISYQ